MFMKTVTLPSGAVKQPWRPVALYLTGNTIHGLNDTSIAAPPVRNFPSWTFPAIALVTVAFLLPKKRRR